MTEPKWTKGSWTVKLVRGSYQRPALVLSGRSKVVASCIGNQLEPDATSIREAEANARLIAAAPELYEALDLARHYVKTAASHYVEGMGGFSEDLAKVDAALAKARGE